MGKRLTSGYTFVVHEVTTTSVKLWMGALSPSIGKPYNWRLVIKKANTARQREKENGKKMVTARYGKDEWQKPFHKLKKRFYCIKTITHLKPATHYIAEFQIRSELEWRTVEKAFFTTLPNRLPTKNRKPFTVGIGSCFYTEHDGGDAGQAYEALYHNEKLRPDIKFLAGDQVYTDIGLGWYPLDESDCQDRIADHYTDSWKYLRSILRRGGTWMISDDHEYWNNYPFFTGFNPYLVTLEHNDDFRQRWKKAAHTGVSIIQQAQPVRTFDIGKDLSFCVADLRMERSDSGFLSRQSFKQLISWIQNLGSPGVLVIPQPLIIGKGNKTDKTLADWDQYQDILKAIESGQHDIVVLTGDVHYGRVSQVLVGSSQNKLTEIITSPLSNLSEINGIAASTPDLSARKFPIIKIDGMVKTNIHHLAKVTTESKWWDLRYPVERTHEHFMTVAFYRDSNDKVKMKVEAWHTREMVKRTGLPKKIKDFKVNTITLT